MFLWYYLVRVACHISLTERKWETCLVESSKFFDQSSADHHALRDPADHRAIAGRYNYQENPNHQRPPRGNQQPQEEEGGLGENWYRRRTFARTCQLLRFDAD